MFRKKAIGILLVAGVLAVGMTGCASGKNAATGTEQKKEAASTQTADGRPDDDQPKDTSKKGETVTVVDASGAELDVKVNPKRVAFFEPSALDVLDAAGMEKTGIEKIGVQKTESCYPEYLQKYMGDEYVNVGSLFQADYDTLDLLNPELIIYGGRLGAQDQGVSTIETLKKRYPDADFIAYEVGGDSFLSDVKRNCKLLARIFPGIKDYVNEGIAEIEQNIQKIHDKVGGRETLFLMAGGGYLTFYGPEGRFAMVHNEFGFTPADTETEAITHKGADVNAEYVRKINPKVILLLDHATAIGGDAASNDMEAFMKNNMIRETDAYKNGDIYTVDPATWYINPGGLTSTRQMITDLMVYVEKLEKANQ